MLISGGKNARKKPKVEIRDALGNKISLKEFRVAYKEETLKNNYMQNMQQRIMEEVEAQITAKEKELEDSDKEIARIWAQLIVEKKVYRMDDLESSLREDFKYGVSALEDILTMEEGKNKELEKDLVMLRCRKSAILKCTEEELQYP